MATRQNNLFAAEDWKIAYKAYSKINFQAYDFDTIRSSLVEYIKTNYPENFNDYIDSSEFIAIIDLLSYLSQSLAFRMDLNSRENFLSTAESRDSIFKLAKMLGYNPQRNIPASGLMKITSVRTNEPITDSLGKSLSGRTIYWDDVNNGQSYEQFITVLNSAMSKTNRFTAPVKEGTINSIPSELYQLNTPLNSPLVYNLSLSVNGVKRNFNIVNPDLKDNDEFYERHPDPANPFNLIYRNDSKGLSSKDTGFFVMFKQGELQAEDFNFTTPRENRLQTIAKADINESDVYLQEINANGTILNKWTKIPNTVGQTLNYTSSNLNTRNLYSVENLGSQGIQLRFGDGNFSNIPNGIYRLWHRVSSPTRYVIKPGDAKNKSITIPYRNEDGKDFGLTITFDLMEQVSNSAPAESLSAIKQRAPQVFYTQNRMVSAQDYNVFPQSQSTNITKMKAMNRTHSGHSRYIDINDPTGTYKSVDTFANDAYLYINDATSSEQLFVNDTSTPVEITASLLTNKLKELPLNNFVYYSMRNIYTDPLENGSVNIFKYSVADNVLWNTQPSRAQGATGYLTEQFSTGDTHVLINNPDITASYATKLLPLKENCFLKFVDPDDTATHVWVRAVKIANNGALSSGLDTGTGPWTLSDDVPTGYRLSEVVPSLRKQFSTTEASAIVNKIKSEESFALGYDLTKDTWYVIPSTDLSSSSLTNKFSIDNTYRGADSWLLYMNYSAVDANSYKYDLTVRGFDYVVQSQSELKFYNTKSIKVLDSTNRSKRDKIVFTSINTRPGETETFNWTGSAWQNETLGVSTVPRGRLVEIPLRTRDTTWEDVEVSWVSNFGLLRVDGGTTVQSYRDRDLYVNDAVVPLNTFRSTGGVASETNVVIQSNTGKISSMPNYIDIPFNATTFGSDIVDDSGTVPFVVYKQLEENGTLSSVQFVQAYLGNDNPQATDQNGLAIPSNFGRLLFTKWDSVTRSGTLRYKELQNSDYLYLPDTTGVVSQDKLSVYYENNRDKLSRPIEWDVVDVFREADGYIDPRKIKVAPIDSDGDLVPDRPLQFSEYVDKTDLVFFEYYNDFDGYRYDRPFEGNIFDLRNENSIDLSNSRNTLSPGSYSNVKTLSDLDWVVVKNKTLALQFENKSNASGIVIYVVDDDKTYQVTPVGTSITETKLIEAKDHFVRAGRGKTQNTALPTQESSVIKWSHVAPNDVRIDPSISNVIEMVILTSTYYDEVVKWQKKLTGEFPLEPTSSQLNIEFEKLNDYKNASDSLVFRSSKFKLLFGQHASNKLKAKFRVVKLSDQYSDNELKTKIISVINAYFNVQNWEFGETFYFTELSTYIHQQLGSAIGSIVIMPKNSTGKFGEMFQVKSEPNELFLSTATVNDIEIISRLDSKTLSNTYTEDDQPVSKYANANSEAGPYAIEGYYPLYSSTEAATLAGNGTYHSHVFFGQTFYMPNGVTYYHGNYNASDNGSSSSSSSGSSSSGSSSSGSSSNSGGSGY